MFLIPGDRRRADDGETAHLEAGRVNSGLEVVMSPGFLQ